MVLKQALIAALVLLGITTLIEELNGGPLNGRNTVSDPLARDGGFVLRGVLVAMLAAGVLGVLLPPAAGRAWGRFQGGSAADAIAESLTAARTEAIRAGQPVRVVFDERRRSWEVDGRDYRRLPDGLALAAPSRGTIVFHPDGSSSGGQVVVSQVAVSGRGEAWALAVELPSGAVRRRHAGGEPTAAVISGRLRP